MKKNEIFVKNPYYGDFKNIIDLLEKEVYLVDNQDYPYHIHKYSIIDVRIMMFGTDNYGMFFTMAPLDAIMNLHNEQDREISVDALGKILFRTLNEANKCRHEILRGKQISLF